jgi:hypothetical protein
MQLDLSYAEMSFLRYLVQKEKMRIWHEEWAANIKNKSEIASLFEKWNAEQGRKPPLGDLDCCRLLQTKFEELESQAQAAIAEAKEGK